MTPLDRRIHCADGDVWQAEGRLRAALGGGALELPGVRLMASGIAHPQWNNGSVDDAERFDPAPVRAWYRSRANGNGVPWGLSVPTGMAFSHGRRVFTKRCMALVPAAFVPPPVARDIRIDAAQADAVDTLARIDAEAFGDPVALTRAWIAPRVGAEGFTVAVARIDGAPIGAATAVFTDDRAGACVGIFGVGVVQRARKRGVATALAAWLLERAFAGGATLAHLNPNHDSAARVYARLGFVETAGLDIHVDV
jgi:GNAT superfamily N-acetyltransferase